MPGRVDLTVRMVRAAVRHSVGHPSCLEESLALWWLLGRQGIASELRIGVRKHDEKFEAHAWVERKGVAVNEPESLHEHYAAFDAALYFHATGTAMSGFAGIVQADGGIPDAKAYRANGGAPGISRT